MLLTKIRASRLTCFRASNYAGKTELQIEKCRDPKDFKRHAGRPDDRQCPGILPKIQRTKPKVAITNKVASHSKCESTSPVASTNLNDDKLKLLPNLGQTPVKIVESSPVNKPSPSDLIVINKHTSPKVSIAKKPKQTTLKIVDETLDDVKRHRVYASGWTETGALGLHKPKEGRRLRKSVLRPLRHQFAEETKVITVECGYGFSLFYVKSDSPIKLYGCGLNSDFQLGATELDVVTYPLPIDVRLTSPKTKLVSLSAGRAHAGVVTDDEGVFLFGSNRYGQCGRSITKDDAEGKTSSVCTIAQIQNVDDEKVVKVTCGQDHTFLLSASGKVFGFGLSECGQTGLGGQVESVWKPSRVEGDIKNENIVKVTGKCDTTLALNDRGELFGWGSNEFRQLVNDVDVNQIDEPVRLKNVNYFCGKIVDVAAGSSFCLVLNEDGDVFVWGRGILGGGPELSSSTKPVLLPRTLFGCNDYHPDVRTIKIFCGVDHMAAVNSVNHVYVWGKNKHGCLGIGQIRDQYFPYKLAHGAKALHVTCSVDHTFILTDHS